MMSKRAFALILTLIMIISMTSVLPAAAASVQTRAASIQYSGIGTDQTYIVLYQTNADSTDAARVIAEAGGQLVYSYSEIGVVIASSNDAAFRANLLKDSRIEASAVLML